MQTLEFDISHRKAYNGGSMVKARFSPEILEEWLVLIAGVAYTRQKSYKIVMQLGQYGTGFDISDRSVVKFISSENKAFKKFVKKKRTGHYWSERDYPGNTKLQKLESIRRTWQTLERDIYQHRGILSKYGFAIDVHAAAASHKEEGDYNGEVIYIPYTHNSIVATLTVDPTFLQKFFPQVASTYKRIGNYAELKTLALDLASQAAEFYRRGKRDNKMRLSFYKRQIVARSNGSIHIDGFFTTQSTYATVGMADAPNQTTVYAIGITTLCHFLAIHYENVSGRPQWKLAVCKHFSDDDSPAYVEVGVEYVAISNEPALKQW